MAAYDENLAEPLFNDNDEGEKNHYTQRKNGRNIWSTPPRRLFLLCLWLLSTVGMARLYGDFRVARAKRLCGQLLYSPAQDFIEYRLQTFTQGFGEGVTEYYGPPSDEMDERWDLLWNFSVGEAITREEAGHLSNVTSSLGPLHPELYWVKLDVFHQLHCLNTLRMSLWPEYYRERGHEAALTVEHLDHCIDTMRQSIMCHSDITPLLLQYDESIKVGRHRANVPHSCRNFDKIRDWAVDRAIGQMTYDGNWMDPDLVVDGLKLQEP